jgi:hypothetical protein
VEEQKNFHYCPNNYKIETLDPQLPYSSELKQMDISLQKLNLDKEGMIFEEIEKDFFEQIIKDDTSQILEEKLKENSGEKKKSLITNEKGSRENNDNEPINREYLLFEESAFFNYDNKDHVESNKKTRLEKESAKKGNSEQKNVEDSVQNEKEEEFRDFHSIVKRNFQKSKLNFLDMEENFLKEQRNDHLNEKYLSFLKKSIIFFIKN